jgi:hypothetical protein
MAKKGSGMIWVNKYDDGVVEGSFTENGKLCDARVRFMFKDKFGEVIATTVEIPVLSLLELSYVIDTSLKTYRLKIQNDYNRMIGEHNGKKD